MAMDAALTTLREEDIQKHLATAQSLVTKTTVIEAASSKSKTEIAGKRRRGLRRDRPATHTHTHTNLTPSTASRVERQKQQTHVVG